MATALNIWENNIQKIQRFKTFCIVIDNVLSIVINIKNTTIFEPVILTGFYTSLKIISITFVCVPACELTPVK